MLVRQGLLAVERPPDDGVDATRHLLGRASRKRQQQDAFRVGALEIEDPVDEHVVTDVELDDGAGGDGRSAALDAQYAF